MKRFASLENNYFLAGTDYLSRPSISVTRFGEISPLWQNYKSLWAIFWMAYLVFGKPLYQLWHFYAMGQIAIFFKWPKIE